ncbi:MAG: aminotransferase class III-fold pyridoxal phosphate-dependent enzyme [Betaproteobacteria bacterium]|nr:aminotransferase class III-fold pyridoxal phosphate-dependent enzyme [Betaproteobacteria bacterium]
MTPSQQDAAAPGSLEAKDLEHLLHPVTNLKLHREKGPTIAVKAKGVYLWDEKGRQYLEGMAGLWCTALGYGEEELARAAKEQMEKLCYSQLFSGRANEPSILLAEKLKSMVPMDAGRVFFGLSGSDANDTQVKLMWYYHNAIGKPERKKIIARNRGYHGATVAAGSLTGLPPFHKNFDLPIAGILHTDSHHYYRDALPGESEAAFVDRIIGNLEKLIQAEGPETVAAFIAEPIPGVGGVIVPSPGYYAKLQALLERYGIFFIDDEVICGFGRTGKPFGAETVGIRPTTMSLAKALTSAYLPLSAVIIPEFMYEPLVEASGQAGVFGHGFTYTGHPVCAAVALRNLELIEQRNVFAHVAKVSEPFQARLRAFADHPLVGEARGVGLIGAVELVADKNTKAAFDPTRGVAAHCVARCEANGLIVRSVGETIAFCPPLIVTEDQVHELFDKLARSLEETLHWVRAG